MKRMIRNRKKLNGKRIAAAAVAGLSAAAVVMTAVLSDVMEAEAADTLLGIEKLRTRYKESGSEFVILEVVPDRSAAEIGYLVDGYEPILCEWDEEKMVWSNWKNTLCELPKTRRKDFVEGKKEELREYYAKQGIEENFPVEAVEDEYEEGEPRQEGFERIVSDGATRTGWFQKISGTPAEGTDRYQLTFNFNGLYNGNYEFYEGTLYYTVSSATKIDQYLAGGIENDRPIYTKEGEGVYAYCGTWEEINNVVIASFDEDLPEKDEEEDKENEEKPNPDDEKNDDDDKNNGGSGDENSGDSGSGGENEDNNGNGDDDSNEDNNGGDDSGSEDNNSGDDSSNGDSNGSGGDDSSNEDNNGGNSSEDDNSGNDDGSNGDSNGDSDSNAQPENTGAAISSTDVAKRTTSVFASLREGKWFKLVADDTPADGSDDNAGAGDQLNPGDADVDKTGQDDKGNQTDTDGNAGADNTNQDDADSDNTDIDDNVDPDETDTDDNTDPDKDGPAADDPVDDDESEKNTLAQEEGAKEYYLVAFERVSADEVPKDGTPMYAVINIELSEDGEYEFVEWDGVDGNQPRQDYTFKGKEIWCKNTFKSNEWFKKYVLNMDKVDYGDFRIKVLTFTPQELNDMEEIPNFDFLYLNSGLRVDGLEDGGDVSGNSIDTGDDGNTETDDSTEDDSNTENGINNEGTESGSEVSALSGSVIKSKLIAADSIQGTWRRLVANDNVEESIDSLGKDGTLENDSESDTDSGSGNDGGSDTDSNSGNDGGSDTSNGSESSGGSDIDSSSENAGDSDTGSGSENSGDSETDGDSGSDTGSVSDDTGSASQDGDDSEEGSISENSTGSDKKTIKATSDSVNDDSSDKTVHNYLEDNNDLSEEVLTYFFDKTIAGAMPCLVDGSILYVKDDSGSIAVNEELQNTNIFRLSAMLCQDNLSEWYEQHRNNYARLTVKQLMDGIVEDADKNFVEEQVYCRFGNGSDSIINDQFAEATIYKEGKEIEPGFQSVLDEIELENQYRESDTSGNYKPLSTSISQAKAVRHILNYRDRRKVETKKHVRVLEIQPAMADTPELTLEQLKTWAPGVETADITVMTTAEFIGKIEKLNETYDLIYIGTSKDHLNMRYWTDSSYYGKPDEKHVAAGTVFNDSDMDGLIYYNIGDLRVVTLPMAGLLTSEYWNGNRNDWTYFYNYARYGGNDISKEKMNALVSFLDGSYPVIVADDFMEQPATVFEDIEYGGCRVNLSEGEYTQRDLTALGIPNKAISSIKVKDGYSVTVFDEDNFRGNSATFTKNENNFVITRDQGNWNDRVVSMIIEREEGATPSRRIDEDHIDNCSYLYEFVKKAMDDKYVNFYAWGDIEDDSELFKFYLNRPKVSLTETAVNGEGEEGSDLYYINPDRNGRYTLQYRFKIQNEGAASYNTRYVCKLYIDVNSDGKFSGQEEIEDITITQNGGYVSQDALYADRDYILSRQVPTGYKGLLPWKVEITQADNENIYTSMSGYTKLNGMEKEVLKICQINKNGSDVIDLNYEVNTKGRHFNTLVYGGDYDGEHYTGISDEFELDITTIDINTFQSRYYENNEYLKDFNMLILGFSDMYGDFAGDSENGPMGAIVDFINSGKSVLLAHDTTSYFNSPDLGQGDQAMKGYPWRDNHGSLVDIWWYNEWKGWYYTRNASTLNKYVRPLVGMDRYGLLDSDILQRGDILRQGSGDYETVVSSGKDVAYKPKSGKKETVPEVHGYTYQLLSAKDQQVPDDENNVNKYVYSKWNLMSPGEYDGVPNNVFENKYTNIRYDAAWFWDDVKEDDSARYGELEKVNNGEVNGIHATQVNKGQITEYPYKLKEEFEVAITHGQYYELDYTADDDGDGQSDLVVWYCLGERTSNDPNKRTTIYSQSPNDVRNNYYIYNKGNITYTGMGHARKDWDGEWYTFEEAKLFINTMIASYQAGIKDPQISVLKSGVPESDTMKLLYRYYDRSNNFSLNDEMTAEDYEKIYFTVEDINFIKGTRRIESHVYYQDDGGGEVINVDGTDITVTRLPDSIYSVKDGSAVDATNLTSAGIYYIQVPKQIMKKCEDGLDLYFEAQSTITTNTTKANVYKTEKVYAKLQVLQAYLFDLE